MTSESLEVSVALKVLDIVLGLGVVDKTLQQNKIIVLCPEVCIAGGSVMGLISLSTSFYLKTCTLPAEH